MKLSTWLGVSSIIAAGLLAAPVLAFGFFGALAHSEGGTAVARYWFGICALFAIGSILFLISGVAELGAKSSFWLFRIVSIFSPAVAVVLLWQIFLFLRHVS